MTSDQLTKFQALVQAAGSDPATDALPGCPPADSSSGSQSWENGIAVWKTRTRV